MKMKASVLSLKNLFIKDKALISAFFAALTGVLTGALIYGFKLNNTNNPLFDLFISFNTDFTGKSQAEIFSGIAISVLVYFLALFLSGTSFTGKYLCIFATFFKMLGIGAFISFLYVKYGLKGLEYVLLVFFPGKTILFFSSLFMTKNSFDMSNNVKNGIYEKGSSTDFIKTYYLRSMIILFVFLLSAVVDFVTIKVFSPLFDFLIL